MYTTLFFTNKIKATLKRELRRKNSEKKNVRMKIKLNKMAKCIAENKYEASKKWRANTTICHCNISLAREFNIKIDQTCTKPGIIKI